MNLNSQKKSDILVSGKKRVQNSFLEKGLVFEDAVKRVGLAAFKQRFQLLQILRFP